MDKLIVSNPFNNKSKERVYDAGNYSSFYNWETAMTRIIQANTLFDALSHRTIEKKMIEREESANRDLVEILANFNRYRANNKIELGGGPSEIYSVQGQYFDLGRILSGEPECMVDCFSGHEKAPQMLDIYIRLCSPIWLSEPGHEKRLFDYYGPILDAIDVWEQNGVRCRITCDMLNADFSKNVPISAANQVKTSFLIKDYHQIFDMELFCRIFMTMQVCSIWNYIIRTAAKKDIDKSCSWASMDFYNVMDACKYDPTQPDKIIFPSAWYTRKMNFNPDSPEVLLSKLGYPLPQTNY